MLLKFLESLCPKNLPGSDDALPNRGAKTSDLDPESGHFVSDEALNLITFPVRVLPYMQLTALYSLPFVAATSVLGTGLHLGLQHMGITEPLSGSAVPQLAPAGLALAALQGLRVCYLQNDGSLTWKDSLLTQVYFAGLVLGTSYFMRQGQDLPHETLALLGTLSLSAVFAPKILSR